MNEHISSRRRRNSQEKIISKINKLEDYLQNGFPKEVYLPSNFTDFRLWEDAKLNLEIIGSPNTLNKPYNRQLKLKIKELIKALAIRRKQKHKKSNVLEDLQNQIKEKDGIIKSLAAQWHSTREELLRSIRENERSLNEIKTLKKEILNLNKIRLFKK